MARITIVLGLLGALLASGCASSSYTPIRTHFNKGVRFYEEENYPGAAREYRLALEEDPHDFRARFNLAMTLEEMDRKDLARAEYEWILSARPDDLRASANLAALEIEAGEKEAAYARLQALVDRYGTMAMPRVALATHYLRDGRYDEATTLVREALRIDESDIEANFLLGELLEKNGDSDGARAAYLRALKNSPNDVASLLALGRIERAAGKPDLARNYFRRVILQRHNALDAHRGLAGLEEEAGAYEEAVKNLWAVRRLDAAAGDQVARDLARVYRELLRQAEERAAAATPETRPD